MMITYPNAKINLGLNVVSKRPDGYHNLETVFYPIPLCDTLSLEALAPEQHNTTDYLFNIEGTPVDCAPEKIWSLRLSACFSPNIRLHRSRSACAKTFLLVPDWEEVHPTPPLC